MKLDRSEHVRLTHDEVLLAFVLDLCAGRLSLVCLIVFSRYIILLVSRREKKALNDSFSEKNDAFTINCQ